VDTAMTVFKKHPLGQNAAVIGRVVAELRGKVYVGGKRLVDVLVADQLPRICLTPLFR